MYDDEDPEKVFKVVTLKNRYEWETICWSRKSSCTIKHLEPNTCYSMKVLVMVAKEDQFDVVDSSEIIKVGNFTQIMGWNFNILICKKFNF
jgi:hypothetical protein